jgi:hypothetical protein
MVYVFFTREDVAEGMTTILTNINKNTVQQINIINKNN